MELLSLLLYLLITLTLLQAFLSFQRRSRTTLKLPPGPFALPVIGNLLKLGDKPHRSLADLAKTYGDIMTLKLGQVTAVVISSSTMAKQVLQKQDIYFCNRSIPDAIRAHDHHLYSVAWLPVGDRWRSLRKVLNSNLFSAKMLDANQHLRSGKVQELIAYTEKCCEEGVAVDIGNAAFTTSLNLLSNTIFSADLADLSQESVKEFKDLVRNIMVEGGKPNLVDYFPLLTKIDPQGVRRRMMVYFGKVLELFGGLIEERLEVRRMSKAKTENDVLDILLNISEEIDRTHIEHLCLDLIVAGTDTTSDTVEWAMAELLQNPETLEKAKAELEQTIGEGKLIQESDISHLPYLQAIVKETLRMYPGPLLLPRKAEMDIEVCGYTVPRGSQVLVNTWAINHDPSLWPQPTSFRPERFLDSEIDVRGHDFELIPFGAGRRICPGLPLAIRMVQVMLGSLLNSFHWKLEGGIAPKDLNMEEKFGLSMQKAQPLRAVPIRM